jgi:putative DNA primase/helicase
VNVAAIPQELRDRRQWVAWRYLERDGKATKVPYRADGQGLASTTDPDTWATFEDAIAAAVKLPADGVGYVFSADDPYVGVDLDDGLSEADRAAIMLALDSYAETSVSGSGVHVILRASLNGHGHNRRGPFEAYEAGRYFVVTGEHVIGTPATIEERQVELDEVLAQFLPKPDPKVSTAVESSAVDLDDRELLDKAMAARNGAKFRDLWKGQWEEHRYPSQSEADQALCALLAFWTGNDPDRIDRLFRSSGLYREKWDRDNYGEKTIANVLGGDVYTPATKRPELSRGSDSPDSPTGSLGTGGGNGVGESALYDSPTPDAPVPVGAERRGSESDSDSDSDSDSPDSPPVFALPVHEFIAREREHREPLLASEDGRAVVGARSLALVGSLGGQGKTTLSIDVFLHMAAGVDYPPWRVPRPVPILMIENEGPEELFAEKLKARLEHFPHELKARLDVCTFDWGGFSLADDEHRLRLTAEIADKGYELVFGDPLDALGIEGVGSPEDTRKFLALMKQTGLNKTVAWWLNTHPRKEETKDALNEISGAWGGKPDSVFLLRMLEDDRTQLRQPKLRWARRGKGPTLLLAFDADPEAFSYLGEQSEEERDYLADVIALLKDAKWRTVKEIAAPTAAGGIAANEKIVRKLLEEHPDVFVLCTGDDAKALGRSSQATLWQLAGAVASSQTALEAA